MIKKWSKFNEDLIHRQRGLNHINDDIDFTVLAKLEDERDLCVVGDDVIATYFTGGYETYKFKLGKQRVGLGCLVNGCWYAIQDAYHVVRKETYNDFIEPEKVLERAAPRKSALVSDEIPECLLYLSTEIEEDTKRFYESAIDGVFTDLHDKYNTVSGDADFTTDTLMSDYKGSVGWNLIETTTHQVIRNMDMSSIAKSLKSDRVNFQVLNELKDERNSLEDGEKVVLVTNEHLNSFMSKLNNFLIKVVVGTYNESEDGVVVSGKNNTSFVFSIEDCIHVVKKETYEDFAGSLK